MSRAYGTRTWEPRPNTVEANAGGWRWREGPLRELFALDAAPTPASPRPSTRAAGRPRRATTPAPARA
jgi:hypothetical protein